MDNGIEALVLELLLPFVMKIFVRSSCYVFFVVAYF